MQPRQILTLALAPSRIFYFFSHQDQKRKFFKLPNPDPKPSTVPTVYPNQYPRYPLTDAQPIISRERPVRHLTPKYEVPDQKMMEDQDLAHDRRKEPFKSPENSFALNVGLIGPVNAGKSQLFGALSYHISAVSPKASTTTQIIQSVKCYQRDSEQGIRNIQLKFFDTPGLMYKKQGFISKGWKVLSEIDFSLLVVDSAKRFDDMIKESIKRLEKHREYGNFMKALVLNKIDLVDNRRKFDLLIREIERYGKFDKIFHVSAKTGYGIEQLQEYLLKMAKPREWQHPPQTRSNLTQLQILEQLLRQSIFARTYKELPHELDITCTSFSTLSSNKDQILFDLHVGTENQQRMVIGTEGANVREIVDRFRVAYARMYGREGDVQVTVKVRNNWRDRFRGREEMVVRDQEMQDQQKMRILKETLASKRSSGIERTIQPPIDKKQ